MPAVSRLATWVPTLTSVPKTHAPGASASYGNGLSLDVIELPATLTGDTVIYVEAKAGEHLQRAEFGTRGWRLIALDENGEWNVGERDPAWPPLPGGPR